MRAVEQNVSNAVNFYLEIFNKYLHKDQKNVRIKFT